MLAKEKKRFILIGLSLGSNDFVSADSFDYWTISTFRFCKWKQFVLFCLFVCLFLSSHFLVCLFTSHWVCVCLSLPFCSVCLSACSLFHFVCFILHLCTWLLSSVGPGDKTHLVVTINEDKHQSSFFRIGQRLSRSQKLVYSLT